MSNILITGSRAPVALDLGKKFKKQGNKVFFADSMKPNLSNFSNVHSRFFLVSKPKFNLKGYEEDLIKIIKKYDIDILIPTCEEIFYVAQIKDSLEKYTNVFCEDIDKLNVLHNKLDFIQLTKKFKLNAPKTEILDSKDKLRNSKKFILKRMYSRFASNIIKFDEKNKLKRVKLYKNNPWLKQEFIQGKQFCTYSIAINGKLLAHSCYPCDFLIDDGACLNFKNIKNEKILDWVIFFVNKFNFTGQISFDFILDKNGNLFCIECNPRATSGVHLFNDKDRLDLIFLGKKNKLTLASGKNQMISLAMLFFAFPNIFNFSRIKEWFKVMFSYKDPIFSIKDIKPFFFQIYISVLYMFRSIKKGTSITEETTFDIEWDGKWK